MKTKIITFFLASSITDLEYDRLAVGDFINQLNSIYASSDIFIKLYKCESETEDHAICEKGSQASIDDIIKSSDLCFVIFWHKAGDVTFHELEVALEAHKQCNKPKIVVYFKRMMDNEKPSEDIIKIMEIIDHELLHYHREYEHIDSLKLGIITQLQVHGFINVDLSVQGDDIMCDNNRLMSVKGIPLFADNAEYTSLLEQYTKVVNRCKELQTLYVKDNGNFRLYREFCKLVKERDRLKSDITELSDHILDIGNSIASMTVSGKSISEKIRQAINCFDTGDYEGVLSVLNPADIEKNIAELDEIEKNVISERIAIVEEYRLRILALKAQTRWAEVYETYVKAVEQVQSRPQMPKMIMYEYASFLFQQTQYNKCIEVCHDLDKQYVIGDCATKISKGKIDTLCGLAYYKIGNYAKAHDMLLASMQAYKKLAKDNASYELDYVESCTNMARVYYSLDNHLEAEKLYHQALFIYHNAKTSDDINIKLADVHMSLADLYYQTNKHREAETLFSEALEVCKDLAETQPTYIESVANLCSRLAHINYAILSHRFSDRYFIEALKTRSRLLQIGKSAFASLLDTTRKIFIEELKAQGYEEYAKIIKNTDTEICSSVQLDNEIPEADYSYYEKPLDCKQMEDWSIQALQIRRKLANNNPEAYEGSVAEDCRNLAEIYMFSGEYNKSEGYLKECLEIQNRLMSFKGEQKNAAIAATYCSFANLYFLTDNFEKSEKMYLSAIEIYRSLSFTNELARTSNHLGRLYGKFGKTQESIFYFVNSIALYINLYTKSPGAYIDRVLNTMANALYALCPQKEREIMTILLTINN